MALLQPLRGSAPWGRRSSRYGVLTDREIHRARERGELRIEPFDEALLRPAAVSLRLGYGGAVVLVPRGPVDTASRATYPEHRTKELDEHGRLALEPGEVVLAPTLERISVSDWLVGVLDGTSDYARLGISVVLSHQVSPGYGKNGGAILTLEIVSRLAQVVYLHPGTRICNLMLFRCRESGRSYADMPHNYSLDVSVGSSRLADYHA